MAPVMLPKPTRETEIFVREISFARDIRPTGSGPAQRQDRIGTRHAISYDIPALKYAWCGAGLAADVAVGRTGDGAVIEIPEPKIPNVPYGTPQVDGSDNLGRYLKLKGIPAGTVIKKGKWLSFMVNGRHYAYFAAVSDKTVASDGKVTLDIYPMIRRLPPNNTSVDLAKPKIQGLIKDPPQRKIMRAGGLGINFEVEEQE